MTQLTNEQATAIEHYRAATASNDFNAYLFAVAALNDAGLSEADANERMMAQ